jgi:hypothetical protein
MKFQAPQGVTALFCAGEAIAPDGSGCFDAAENLTDQLAAHGCAPIGEAEPAVVERSRARGSRVRVEKVS